MDTVERLPRIVSWTLGLEGATALDGPVQVSAPVGGANSSDAAQRLIGKGVALALAGMATTGFGAYLGGHLAAACKVGSRHPTYDDASRGVST